MDGYPICFQMPAGAGAGPSHSQDPRSPTQMTQVLDQLPAASLDLQCQETAYAVLEHKTWYSSIGCWYPKWQLNFCAKCLPPNIPEKSRSFKLVTVINSELFYDSQD